MTLRTMHRGRRCGAADDREVLDGDGDRLLDRERRAARDQDRRGALTADAQRAGAADVDAVAEVVDAGREADRAARRLHLVDGVLQASIGRSGVRHTVHSQPPSPPSPSGGQSRRQSVCEPGNVTKPSRA